MTNLAVSTTFPALEPEARALAIQLHLPFSTESDYQLLLTPHFLGLQKKGVKPLYVDFLSPDITRRRKQASVKKEALARALGLKKNSHPRIIDATAGLGRDSFILASLGFEVELLERSPIVFALLEDGLKRAAKQEETAAIVSRLHLISADAISWLKTNGPADVVYLDPMFPEKQKSALAKKNMQFFQDIIGKDPDTSSLLQAALTCATQRVVVKRPRLAAPLADHKPSFCLIGKSSRFDIYLKENHARIT